MEIDNIPAVTSLDKFEAAVEAFERGGGRSEYMARLLAIGLPADAIRWLAAYPGRTMIVQDATSVALRSIHSDCQLAPPFPDNFSL